MDSINTGRQSSFELLRLVAMAMIVLHHFIFHGLGIYRWLQFGDAAILEPTHTQYALVADSFLICGVNVFVLISGWFSIRIKAKSFVKLFAMCSFFSVLGYAVYLFTNNVEAGFIAITLRFLKRAFFVISSKKWWFIQLYFLLMFLSTPMNDYIESASRKTLLLTISVFAFINVYLGWIWGIEYVKDGYNLFNFIMLYLIGRYLRLYWQNNYKASKDLLVFLSTSCVTAAMALWMTKRGMNSFHAMSYNSPFVIVGAISLLLLFAKMHFTNKSINYLASSCLAIYLFQEGVFNFYRYIKQMYIEDVRIWFFLLIVFAFFVLSMFVPIVIDKFRLMLFGNLEERLAKTVDERFVKPYIENNG